MPASASAHEESRGPCMKRVRKEVPCPKIQFYDKLHIRSMQYTDFECLSIKRIKILRMIESTNSSIRFSDMTSQEEDVESHFYCRLLCAQAFWSVRWLIAQEVHLFRKRLSTVDQVTIEKYFKETFLGKIDGVSEKDCRILPSSRFQIGCRKETRYREDMQVHFTKVCDLIAQRRVKVVKGYCRMSPKVMKSCLINFYRQFMEDRMDGLYEYMLRNPDERLKRLHDKVFMESRPVEPSSSVGACQKHMPPCMEGLMSKFRKSRHLKYSDRQALCLFLKECGVGVDECIQLMRSIFDVSMEVFNKEYLYSIRHNYGLEGKKANYSSFTCKKIVTLESDPNVFGCPFSNNLGYVGEYMNAKGVLCPDIEDLIRRTNYQEACTMVLSKLVAKDTVQTVNTPVDFYREYRSGEKR